MDDYPYVVDSFCLREFLRAEISYEEMTEGRTNLLFDDYRATLEDFRIAFRNLKALKPDRAAFCDDWFAHVYLELSEYLHLNIDYRNPEGYLMIYGNEQEIMNLIFLWCRDIDDSTTDKNETDKINFNDIIKAIDTYSDNRPLKFSDRRFTLLMKRNSIRNIGTPNAVDAMPTEQRTLFKKFVNDLCRAEDPYGLRAKGFSLVFGNSCFRRDVNGAIKVFEKLYNKEHDPRTAYLIGDIYYGYFGTEPDYDMAFKYYVMSGLEGYAEALLKVAELFSEGRGTVKNPIVARSMVKSLFDQTYNDFCRGDNQCPFTESAFQLGKFSDGGIDGKRNPEEAFKFFNVARYAIDRRIASSHMPQDEALREDINTEFDRLAKEVGADGNATSVISEVPNLLLAAMTDGYCVHVDIKTKDNEHKLVTRRIRKPGEDRIKGIFVEFPLIEYCSLTDLVTESFPKNSKIWVKSGRMSFDAEEMVYDRKKNICSFNFRGETVAKISAGMFVAKLRSKKK